jgi:hypothetical protein
MIGADAYIYCRIVSFQFLSLSLYPSRVLLRDIVGSSAVYYISHCCLAIDIKECNFP